jgi:hypothetical protein
MLTQDKCNEIVNVFLTIQLLVKVYHWNTVSYARHKATDRFTENLLPLVDKFVEIMIGQYNVKPKIESINLNQKYLTDNGIKEAMKFFYKYLMALPQYSSDIMNLRDELIGEINQTLYLFNLD